MDTPVLEIEHLRDAFLARTLSRRLDKMQEDAWVSSLAKEVERDESAVRPRCVTVLVLVISN